MNNRKNHIKKRDDVYGEIAARYVERYGGVLQRELRMQRTSGAPRRAAYDSAKAFSDDVSDEAVFPENENDNGGWSEIGADTSKSVFAGGINVSKRASGRKISPPSKQAPDTGQKMMTTGIETDDRILHSLTTARRKRNIYRACLFLAIICCIFAVSEIFGLTARVAVIFENIIAAAPDSEDMEATAPNGGVETQTTGEAGATGANGTEAADENAGMDDAEDAGFTENGIIPLDLPVKSGYSVVSAVQDVNRTIYFITDIMQDNIVLILRRGKLTDIETSKLTSVSFGDTSAYLSYDADYSLLVYEKDGVIHELTCRYDVNTLVDFCGFEYRGFARGVIFPQIAEGGARAVSDSPVSEIPLKAGAASYIDIRRRIAGGEKPPAGAIVTEEMINYFPVERDDSISNGSDYFDVKYEIGRSPFNEENAVAYVNIKAREFDWNSIPPTHITLLIDTSSSMYSFDKLPLVKDAILYMAEKIPEKGKLSVLTYDGAAEVLLDNAGGDDTESLKNALDDLTSGAETYSGDGLSAAYALARKNYIDGGGNLVIALTDTDDNLGFPDNDQLNALVAQNRSGDVDLCVIAVGALTMLGASSQTSLSEYDQWHYVHADTLTDMKQALLNELTPDSYLLAGGASAQIEFNAANVTAYNLIGYEARESVDGVRINTARDMEHVYAGDEITLLYELELANPDGTPETAGESGSGAGAEAGGSADGATQTGGDPAGGGEENTENLYLDELFELQIIYTTADEFVEETYTKAATFDDISEDNGADFYLACSVAAFCSLLDGDNTLNATFELAESLATAGIGGDAGGYRSAYMDLLRQYDRLTR